MDSSGMEVLCKNSTFGCTFASSSAEDMVKHFQSECPFHPLQCFKCSRMVPKMNFAKHYEQCCKARSASPCSPLEEAPDAAEATASATAKSREEYFLRECVTERAVCVKSLYRAVKDVAADIAVVKGMKEKQQDLEAIVKGQADVIRELGKSIMTVAEKVNKVQEDVSGLANRLEKDAEAIVRRVENVDGSVYKLEKHVGTMVERVENVDGSLKECVRDSKLGVERLSRVMTDLEEAMKETQQDVQAIMKQQGDLIKAVGTNVLTNAEKINKLEQGVKIIVQGVEKVDGLVEDVSAIKRGIADQSTVHWYVENVSQYIEKAKRERERSYVESDVFVIRGYSVKLRFEVEKYGTELWIALYFCLCRGPNDSLLQWPFRITCTLSLIHPNDASKTKEDKICDADFPTFFLFPECFEKPQNEQNEVYGTSELCTVEAAQNEGFIQYDAVCVSLTLHE